MISDDIRAQHATDYLGRHEPCFHEIDRQTGYPETLKRLRAYPLAALIQEAREMLKVSSDRTFRSNAKHALDLVEQVLRERREIVKEVIKKVQCIIK